MTESHKRKVILMEINEIAWDLIDPSIQRGKLPTFARLKREGAWGRLRERSLSRFGNENRMDNPASFALQAILRSRRRIPLKSKV